MNALSAGLVTLANGALSVLGWISSPVGVAIGLSTLSISWLAATRVEELNRQGMKPSVARH